MKHESKFPFKKKGPRNPIGTFKETRDFLFFHLPMREDGIRNLFSKVDKCPL